MKQLAFALVLTLIAGEMGYSQERTWRHVDGRQARGTLIDILRDSAVVRRSPDGVLCTVMLGDLSQHDIAYLRSLAVGPHNATTILPAGVTATSVQAQPLIAVELEHNFQRTFAGVRRQFENLAVTPGPSHRAESAFVLAFNKDFLPVLVKNIHDVLVAPSDARGELDRLAANWILNGKLVVRDAIAAHEHGEEFPTYDPHLLDKVIQRLAELPESAVLVEYLRLVLKDEISGPVPGTTVFRPVSEFYVACTIASDGSVRLQLVQPANVFDEGSVSLLLREYREGIERAERLTKNNRWNASVLRHETNTFMHILGRLRGDLIDPLGIDGYERWYLSPAADIWLIPFIAMPHDDNGTPRFVIEKHRVQYVMSGRDLVRPPPADVVERCVILTNPNFDGSPDFRPPKLSVNSAASLRAVVATAPDMKRTNGVYAPSMALFLSSACLAVDTCIFGQRWRLLPLCRSEPCQPVTVHTSPPKSHSEECNPRSPATLGGLPDRFGSVEALAALGGHIANNLRIPTNSEGYLNSGDATEPAFTLASARRAPDKSLFIICTHGFYLPAEEDEDPLLRCGLALTGANRTLSSGELFTMNPRDGMLYGREIVAIRQLKGVDLALLVACETGVGDIRGDQLASLRHAFTLAGVQSVVASSWQVPVKETVDLVGTFFDMRQVMAAEDALHEAQRRMLSKLRGDANRGGLAHIGTMPAHPYFWASFSLTGTIR